MPPLSPVRSGPARRLRFASAILDAADSISGELPESIPNDPVDWIERHPVIEGGREIAPRGYVWSKQREIIAALSRPRAKVLVHSSQGIGKTWLASRIAMWFILKHRGLDARVIIVGPSWDQLDGGLLYEFRKEEDLYLPGKLSFSRRVVEMDGKDVVDWRSPPEGHSKKNPLQGLHSDKMLVLLEEASNFGFKLWNEATVAITSGGDARVLGFGNPMDTGTPFHQNCKPNSGFTAIHIGTKHTPNFTDEKVPEWLANKLPNKAWVEDTRRTTSDAEYRARVDGLFPNQSEWALIEADWLAQCISNERTPRKKTKSIICIDPGSGGDPTVALEFQDNVIRFIELGILTRSKNREETAAFIGYIAKHKKSSAIVYDSFGVGSDFGPVLARSAPGAKIVSVNSGDRQILRKWEAREYYDPRALMGWRLARRLEAGVLCLPDNMSMAHEIQELRQKWQENGLKRLEKKDDMKERIGRSPNHLDCVLLAQWLDVDSSMGQAVFGKA